MADSRDRIKVKINNKSYEFAAAMQTGAQILAKAGFDVELNELYKVEHGESLLIPTDQTVKLNNGDHFRVMPKDITLG